MSHAANHVELPFLKRVLEGGRGPGAANACDFCNALRPADHRHVVDITARAVLCVCHACYLLFTHDRAAGGRYRAVPERYIALAEADAGDMMQIPVGVAFFFVNSAVNQVAAFYPSPAGATESLLPLDDWGDVVRAHPILEDMQPDVEALLVRRTRERSESYLVPITQCYELVGLMRKTWRGFDGGEDARRHIDAFFDAVRERSHPESLERADA